MNTTVLLKSTVQQPLTFGAVFIKEELVPKRVGFLNILHKVQILELIL